MSDDPIISLLEENDRESEMARKRLDDLMTSAAVTRRYLDDLATERSTLQKIALRKGIAAALVAESEPEPADTEELANASRVNAVERVLMQSPDPMHLTDIQTALEAAGRSGDGLDAISATLSHIARTRKTVTPVGGGRWQYLHVGTNTGRDPVMDQLAADQRARLTGGMDTILSGGPHPENMPHEWTGGDDTHQPY